MDVLITGAGGRIGSQVAQRLLAGGHRVRALDVVRGAVVDELAGLGARVFIGGLTDRRLLADACADVDAVVHTGAVLSSHGQPDDLVVEVNIAGTYTLLTAARDHAPALRRFVNLSSDAVYWTGTTAPAALPVDEHFPRTAGSVYGATKVAAEQLCWSFLHTYGVPVVIARPTATAAPAELVRPDSIFGRRWFTGGALDWWASRPSLSPADDELRRLVRESGAAERDLFVPVGTDGRASVSMINDARDVAAGICLMLEVPEAVGEAFNLGSTEHSEAELVRYLGERLGRPVHEIVHDDKRPSWYVSSLKARSLLGYQPQHDVFGMVDEALARKEVPA